MARIKYSGLIHSIAGSIGGSTFSKTQSGFTVRSKISGRAARQGSFSLQQRYTTEVHSAWIALSQTAKRKWSYFSQYSQIPLKRDNSFQLSGYALFCRWNLMLLNFGMPINESPVFVPFEFAFGTLVLNYSISAGYLYWEDTSGTYPEDFGVYLFLSPPSNRRDCRQKYGLRFMKPSAPDEGEQIEISSSYLSSFGVMAPDDSWFFYSVKLFSLISPIISPAKKDFIQLNYIA